jgi:hypothetical protein
VPLQVLMLLKQLLLLQPPLCLLLCPVLFLQSLYLQRPPHYPRTAPENLMLDNHSQQPTWGETLGPQTHCYTPCMAQRKKALILLQAALAGD